MGEDSKEPVASISQQQAEEYKIEPVSQSRTHFCSRVRRQIRPGAGPLGPLHPRAAGPLHRRAAGPLHRRAAGAPHRPDPLTGGSPHRRAAGPLPRPGAWPGDRQAAAAVGVP